MRSAGAGGAICADRRFGGHGDPPLLAVRRRFPLGAYRHELIDQTVRRTIPENTDLVVPSWELFCCLYVMSRDRTLEALAQYFRSFGSNWQRLRRDIADRTMICQIEQLRATLRNELGWLIPMALDPQVEVPVDLTLTFPDTD